LLSELVFIEYSVGAADSRFSRANPSIITSARFLLFDDGVSCNISPVLGSVASVLPVWCLFAFLAVLLMSVLVSQNFLFLVAALFAFFGFLSFRLNDSPIADESHSHRFHVF